MKKYVITGGPCVGKTTLLKALEQKGYSITEESARAVIEREQELENSDTLYKGIFPWNNLYTFQEEVIKLQKESEFSINGEIIFLDRSLVDGIAYTELGEIEELPFLRKEIQKADYTKIFFLEQLPVYEQDEQRVENEEEGKKLHNKIYEVYKKLGFKVVVVPPYSIEKRVEFILAEI